MRLPALTAMSPRQQEISDRITSRHGDAQYSWNAHVGKAAGAGVSRESLQALAEHKDPGFTRRDEQAVYQLSTEILGEHFVSDATFTLALDELGEQGVVDLIGSLGNFSMLAMLLNTFQVDLQAVDPPFPDVRGFARVPDGPPLQGM